jgi:hypothetical protein
MAEGHARMNDLWKKAAGDALINQFLAQPDCNPAELDNVLAFADLVAATVQSELEPVRSAELQDTAAWRLDAADAAADHGCPNLAKRIYMNVIKTYIGSAYAAQRKRAEIGLEDVGAGALDHHHWPNHE